MIADIIVQAITILTNFCIGLVGRALGFGNEDLGLSFSRATFKLRDLELVILSPQFFLSLKWR